METIDWLTVGGLGSAALGVFLIVWSAVRHGALADRQLDEGDEFTPSIERFGYIQDARNDGRL